MKDRRRDSYGTDSVLHDDYAIGYFTAVLRAGVSVTREAVNQPHYLEILGYDEIPVNMEAPQTGQSYPYVQVSYSNSRFEPASVEEGRDVWDGVGANEHRVYRFEGSYTISVYANTILERETLSDCLIAIMGIDETYRRKFKDNPFINIEPNMHTLSSPTANETWGAPWDADAMTCYRQFRFDVRGEFHYRVGEHPVYLTSIELIARPIERIAANLSLDVGE